MEKILIEALLKIIENVRAFLIIIINQFFKSFYEKEMIGLIKNAFM